MMNMKAKTCLLLSCIFGAFGLLLINRYYQSVNSVSNNLKTEIQTVYDMSHNTLGSYPSIRDKAINLYFMRTHKTGSTNIYNIMARFAWKNNLRFATYKEEGRFVTPRQHITKKVHFDKQRTKYNMFTEHAPYEPMAINKIVHHPVFNLSILRSPVSWLDSFLHYKNLVEPLELNYSTAAVSFVQNLDNGMWYSSHERLLDAVGNWSTKLFLPNLNNTFDQNSFKMLDDIFLVGITEYFDESIILFRRKLGWSFEDVIYLPLCIQTYPKKNRFDAAIHKKFCQWASADCKLYEYFKKSFLEKFHQEGKDIVDEVNHYKSVLKRVWKFCNPFYDKFRSGTSNINRTVFQEYLPLTIPSSKWHQSLTFTVKDCAFTRLKSMVFRAYFYYKQNNDTKCSGKCPVDCSETICNIICQNINNESKLLDKVFVKRYAYIWDSQTSESTIKFRPKLAHF